MYQCYEDYVAHGANFLIAPTYLYDRESEKKEVIRQVTNAAGTHAFTCSAITPCSQRLITSGGTMHFDAYHDKIKQEAKFLYENTTASVMFLFGFDALADAKCAIYAVKEVCDIPICVLLDFKNNMRLADGFDIAAATITLQSLGISALGVMADDCDLTLDILLDMKEFASVPLFAFPRADSHITPYEYAQYAQNYINNKCVMFGIGKGTDSRFVAQIAKELWQAEPFAPDFPMVNAICGKTNICFFDFQNQMIGDCTSIIEIDLKNVASCKEVDIIIEKLVNTGLPPVCFISNDIEVLERAVKLYPGRVAIKSDEYGEITAKEYGAQILTSQKGDR